MIDLSKNRFISGDNIISFVVLSNYIVVRVINTQTEITQEDTISLMKQCYLELSKSFPNADSLIVFPGTQNPWLVKTHIKTIQNLNLAHKIVYDDEEVRDIAEFYDNILTRHCNEINSFTCGEPLTDFKVCNVISLLPNRNTNLVNPIRYYESTQTGLKLDEYNLDPEFLRGASPIEIHGRFASISHLK
jgi:hypothetical protein